MNRHERRAEEAQNRNEPKNEFKTEIPVSFEQAVEDDLKKKGKDQGHRVKKADIDALFRKLKFILGKVSETRIVCTAYLDGFAIADGFSSVVDPRNFDEEIGCKIAQKNCSLLAYDKLWEFEGYRLSRSINEGNSEKESPIIVPKKTIIT